jgi:hypothetical protein
LEEGNLYYVVPAFPSQNILPTIFWSGLKASTLFIKDNYAYDDGHVKSIFTINYRLRNMNLNDRRVSQGLKFSLEAFSLMSKKARAANVIFMVMIIPTKELAFKEIVYNSKNKMPQEFDKLIENEELIIDKIKEHCKKEAIIVIDSTSRLRDYLRRGIQPYKVSIDGHPNVFGQRVLAEVVKDKITDMEAALDDKQQR